MTFHDSQITLLAERMIGGYPPLGCDGAVLGLGRPTRRRGQSSKAYSVDRRGPGSIPGSGFFGKEKLMLNDTCPKCAHLTDLLEALQVAWRCIETGEWCDPEKARLIQSAIAKARGYLASPVNPLRDKEIRSD